LTNAHYTIPIDTACTLLTWTNRHPNYTEENSYPNGLVQASMLLNLLTWKRIQQYENKTAL